MIKTILYSIIAITLSACANQPQITQASQPESRSPIKIPKNFYAEELGQCRMINWWGDVEVTAKTHEVDIARIIGFDWQDYHLKFNTSMKVNHTELSKPLAFLSAASHHAAFNKDLDNIKIATDLIYKIAKGNQFMNTKGYDETKELCYGGNNNTSAPCPIHAPAHLGLNMTTYLISAVWLKEYFSKEQLDILNPYIKKIYYKYIYPKAIKRDDVGFYEMANLGMGTLAYAAWTNDPIMAEKEFNLRFTQIDKLWEENGYIKDNSYRGVRGIYYHSMAVDVVLVYIQLAKTWGYKVPDKVMIKAKKSAELINVYMASSKDYYNFPSSKIPFNASKNPADALGLHDYAIALSELAKNVVDVDFKFGSVGMARDQFIDIMVGFDPKCMFPN